MYQKYQKGQHWNVYCFAGTKHYSHTCKTTEDKHTGGKNNSRMVISWCWRVACGYHSVKHEIQRVEFQYSLMTQRLLLLVFSISGINSTGLILISAHSYVRKHSFQCDSNKQYSRFSCETADSMKQ